MDGPRSRRPWMAAGGGPRSGRDDERSGAERRAWMARSEAQRSARHGWRKKLRSHGWRRRYYGARVTGQVGVKPALRVRRTVREGGAG